MVAPALNGLLADKAAAQDGQPNLGPVQVLGYDLTCSTHITSLLVASDRPCAGASCNWWQALLMTSSLQAPP